MTKAKRIFGVIFARDGKAASGTSFGPVAR